MKRLLVGIALIAGTLVAGGCGFVFVARSQAYTPGYCYDCHYRPQWRTVHTRCDHFEIRVVRGGYYYRPYRHANHHEFRFVKYDHSRDREIGRAARGEFTQAGESGEKEKKSRR